MYADYFGLDEPPFAITPDPRYLFLGRRHAEALAHLLYGIREGGGFVLLTGEVGTGKTTLTRCLLDELPDEVDVALLLNPRLDVTEFLEAICQELGVALPERGGNRRLVDTLNRYLLDAHARGRRTILIVDEAQNLSTDVLEQVRLLTNLETAKTKLLQILLIGQPELRDVLARPELRQLVQRVTARYHLEPLDRDELPEYIAHRLSVAGARAPLFDRAALRAVWRYTAGIPRRVNVLCDRALLGAFSRESREVSPRMVRLAAREIDPSYRARNYRNALLLLPVLAAALAAALLLRQAEPIPPLAAEAEVAAPLPPSFEDWLQANAATTGTDDALTRLFAQWKLEYKPGAAPACEQAAAAGLRCRLERGTWQTLRQFDRPAVLDLAGRDGRRYQLVITDLDDAHRHATVWAGTERREISAVELAVLWSGEFLGLWQPPAGIEPPLLPGSRGPGVIWLRDQLAVVLGLPSPTAPDPDFYDADLAAQVREFQSREHLQVDGIAGEQTLLRLGSRLRLPDVPYLSGSAL